MSLRAAIVGMGKVGRCRYDVLKKETGVNVVACADIDASISAQFPELDFSTDYREIISRDDLDMVLVATSNRVTPDVVCAALETGHHVFCEKPPGRTLSDIERIRAAEHKAPGQKLQFGFNHRYHYAVMEAKNMVNSGVLGKVLWARGVYGKMGGEGFENIWRSDPEQAGGGILLDQGIHMVDLFNYFIGDFTVIKSMVRTMHWDIQLEDNAFALLSNPHGQVAMLHSSATQWKHTFRLELCLEDGYINIDGILSSTRSYGDERLVFARKQLGADARAAGRPREEMIFFDKDDSWRLELLDFLEAIRDDKTITNGSSADALACMQCVDSIYSQASM